MTDRGYRASNQWSGVVFLTLSNGLGISTAVISVGVSALAAKKLGWNHGWATVPYGFQFLAVLVATLPIARLINRLGRKKAFIATSFTGVLSGIAGVVSIWSANPLLLCLCHILMGINLAGVNFYRFAALDAVENSHKSMAMSLVVSGGTFAAILGPLLSRWGWIHHDVFISAYTSVSILNLAVIVLLCSINIKNSPAAQVRITGQMLLSGLHNRRFALGIAVAAIGYGAMNLLMITASIYMDNQKISYPVINSYLQIHVLAMFMPSLFMGVLIRKYGATAIMVSGLIMLVICTMTGAWHKPDLFMFFVVLITLGLSWNMMYVSGSFVASHAMPDDRKTAFQAVNDTGIGVAAMIGAFVPGILLVSIGWQAINWIILFISLILIALIALQSRYTGKTLTGENDARA